METNYGITLLEFRAKHLITQAELAEILGVGVNMIHRYETRKSEPSQVNKIVFGNKMREWEENKNVVQM